MSEQYEVIARAFALKKLPDSEVELTGEIPYPEIEKRREEALKHIVEHLELPGFRKGHVPADMAVKRVGEIAVLEEAVEHVFANFYPTLVKTLEIDATGRPSVAITKLAPGNPVGLTIRTAVFPEIKLPDYKKIAEGTKKDTPTETTEEERTQALDAIRASKAVLKNEKGEPILPEVTDEFVKTLGDFKDVADFNDKLQEHLKTEKLRIANEKHRAAIIDAILAKVEIEVPRVFVESEIEKMIGQMKDDVKRFGMTYEDYLKHSKKTEDDIRNDMKEDGKKRAKLQLTLNKIAEEEKITIPAEEIKKEAQHIIEHFKDADRERVHIYVESMMKNEKVLSMLEGLSK